MEDLPQEGWGKGLPCFACQPSLLATEGHWLCCFCCLLYWEWNTDSSAFQYEGKTSSSPGILQTFSSRIELVEYPATWTELQRSQPLWHTYCYFGLPFWYGISQFRNIVLIYILISVLFLWRALTNIAFLQWYPPASNHQQCLSNFWWIIT